MFLLDTNVIRERRKPQPDEQVRAWLAAHKVSETWLSVMTLAELEPGIIRLGYTKRAAELRAFLDGVEAQFMGRVLPVDRAVANLTAAALQNGQPPGLRQLADCRHRHHARPDRHGPQPRWEGLLHPWSEG